MLRFTPTEYLLVFFLYKTGYFLGASMYLRLLTFLVFLIPNVCSSVEIDIAYGAYGVISVARSGNGSLILLSCDKVMPHYFTISCADATVNSQVILIEDSFGGVQDRARVCAINENGNIFVGGSRVYNNKQCCAIKKYHQDGSVDTSFGIEGIACFGAGGFQEGIYALSCMPDGRILAGGNTNVFGLKQDALLARLQSSGEFDTTFGNKGICTHSWGGFDDTITALAVDAQGALYAGGRSDPLALMILSFALAKKAPIGQAHALENMSDTLIANFHGCSQEVTALYFDDLGKLVAVILTPFIDALPATIARYTPSGELDVSFAKNGVKAPTLDEINSVISVFMTDCFPAINSIGSLDEIPEKYLVLKKFTCDGLPDISFANRGCWHATAPLDRGIAQHINTEHCISSQEIVDGLSDLPTDSQNDWQHTIAIKRWDESELCKAVRAKYLQRRKQNNK